MKSGPARPGPGGYTESWGGKPSAAMLAAQRLSTAQADKGSASGAF